MIKLQALLYCLAWRTHQHGVVFLWFGTQVLEEALLPEPLHQIPILNQAVLDGLLYLVCL